MPKFTGPVRIYTEITIEADDMYQADEIARKLSEKELEALIDLNRADYEIFPDELPSQVYR